MTDIAANIPPANALALALAGTIQEGDRQTHLARLDLYQESIILTRYGERPGDSTTCYEVNPADLCSALSGMPISTGLLPPHCLWYSYQGGVADLGIHVLPRRATLTLARSRAEPRVYRIPLPGLIFAGQGDRYRVFAVRDRQLTAD
ncbi:MAG: prokaryotic E2 ligase family D protein, partial [Chloroflexi bacterium]|nr:prokaryotic E2 ligase family D protein [Chloroflexota bacterium]